MAAFQFEDPKHFATTKLLILSLYWQLAELAAQVVVVTPPSVVVTSVQVEVSHNVLEDQPAT